MAGRPPGAPNKDKPFRDAIRMEAAAGDDETFVPKRSWRNLARVLLDRAASGDVAALKEIADRIDGKVPQKIGGDEDSSPILVNQVVRTIVEAGNPDSQGVPPTPEPGAV